MSASDRRFSLLDAAAPAVHRVTCESLRGEPDEPPLDLDPNRVDEAVMRYGLGARGVYADLRRVVGQVGGLLILAQASGRRDPLDSAALAQAEETHAGACDRLAAIEAPGRLEPHRAGLADAARLAGLALAALRDARADADRRPDLGKASEAVTRAYALLQAASDSRFGMTMVDFRHACCSCGAINR
ncbi:MAG TPA: hypothetical protein VH414_01715 [Lichenihabitans sp.]|jgi:hypothetical protein|nr:hypothetical protein [Lichenihabitans sp.]